MKALDGGRHLGWGTANRIVPLGDVYLELISVADANVAATSVLGSWVGSMATPTGHPLGWAVRPPDLDATAARLALEPRTGERSGSDGSVLRWRTAGIDVAAAEPGLPFFIEWGVATPFPGTPRGGEPTPIAVRLEIETAAHRLSTWLGEHSLPILVRAGTRGLVRVVLRGDAGEIVLEARD